MLIESFQLLPVGGTALAADGFRVLATWTATMFSAGVLLALPLVAALLIANIAMGVLSRVAPQLNLFAVGFPADAEADDAAQHDEGRAPEADQQDHQGQDDAGGEAEALPPVLLPDHRQPFLDFFFHFSTASRLRPRGACPQAQRPRTP